MKLNMIKLVMIVLTVYFNMNCYIGTQRDTCRYNLKDKGIFGPSKDSCELLQVLAGAPLGSEVAEEIVISRAETISFLILNCFQYYQRLQECDKEENRYIPSIYGINTNPVSPSGDAVLSQKF